MRNRFLPLICCLLLSLTACAQKHLEFKGIPVSGSLDVFCQKISEKGLSQISLSSNLRLFAGDFDNQTVRAVVTGSDDQKTVRAFALAFTPSDNWGELVKTFQQYKKAYTKEFGKPSKVSEKNASKSQTNEALMQAFKEGKAPFNCTWKTVEGDVELTIDKTSNGDQGMVVIRYRNNQK